MIDRDGRQHMGPQCWVIYQGEVEMQAAKWLIVTIKTAETQDPEQALNIEKVAGGSKQLGKKTGCF